MLDCGQYTRTDVSGARSGVCHVLLRRVTVPVTWLLHFRFRCRWHFRFQSSWSTSGSDYRYSTSIHFRFRSRDRFTLHFQVRRSCPKICSVSLALRRVTWPFVLIAANQRRRLPGACNGVIRLIADTAVAAALIRSVLFSSATAQRHRGIVR